jgi:hypothetical protein
MSESHGYGPYTRGCRCETCREAKSAYSRRRRAAARALANRVGNGLSEGGRHLVSGITHGRFGYEERGCRCDVCLGARAENYRVRYARHQATGAA